MPVFRIGSKNLLFIHIPKTAGMAIDAQLSKAGTVVFDTRIKTKTGFFPPRHQPGDVLERVFLPQMIDYAFTVVRHPVARLVSEYRYQRRQGGFQLARMRMFGFYAWLRYALWRLAKNPDWRAGHFRPQVRYLCFDCQVFRIEDGLGAVMAAISTATGTAIPCDAPVVNASPSRPVHISRRSLERIAKAYANDFERFGYAVEVPVLAGVTGPE